MEENWAWVGTWLKQRDYPIDQRDYPVDLWCARLRANDPKTTQACLSYPKDEAMIRALQGNSVVEELNVELEDVALGHGPISVSNQQNRQHNTVVHTVPVWFVIELFW